MTGKGITAPSCLECNSLLGASIFPTIQERISFVNNKLVQRYRKALAFPDWSEDELFDVSAVMADGIRHQTALKRITEQRLLWIYSPTLFDILTAAETKARHLFPSNSQLLSFLGGSHD